MRKKNVFHSLCEFDNPYSPPGPVHSPPFLNFFPVLKIDITLHNRARCKHDRVVFPLHSGPRSGSRYYGKPSFVGAIATIMFIDEPHTQPWSRCRHYVDWSDSTNYSFLCCPYDRRSASYRARKGLVFSITIILIVHGFRRARVGYWPMEENEGLAVLCALDRCFTKPTDLHIVGQKAIMEAVRAERESDLSLRDILRGNTSEIGTVKRLILGAAPNGY
ncbi:hexose carrier protein [Moniliophthora roreri]|nr:hexose carrier protein [Moniliophthora roreri]